MRVRGTPELFRRASRWAKAEMKRDVYGPWSGLTEGYIAGWLARDRAGRNQQFSIRKR